MLAVLVTGVLAIGGGALLLKYGFQVVVIGIGLVLAAMGFKKSR